MKNIRLILLSSVLALASCSDSEKNTEIPEPTPDVTTYSLSTSKLGILTGGSSTFKITVPKDKSWTITLPTGSDWLKVEPLNGTGSETITCTTTKNNSSYRERRDANLTVSCDGRSMKIAVKDSMANVAPTATKAALYPKNGATNVADYELLFKWESATDQDGDKLYYELEYSFDNNSWSNFDTKLEVPSLYTGMKAKASTKYYWRVKTIDLFDGESAYSDVFSFTTAAAPGDWSDNEVRLYQESCISTASDPFTLVITGDGFTEKDLKAGGKFDQYTTTAIEALLTKTEPYKTWGSYLRIYRIGAVSEEEGVSQHKEGDTAGEATSVVKTKFGSMYDNSSSSAWCGIYGDPNAYTGGSIKQIFNWAEEQLKKSGVELRKNYAVLVLQNVYHYNGSVYYYEDKNRTIGFICLSTGADGTQTGLSNVITHEIGGHAIGHLADLYTKTGTISTAKVNQTLQYQAIGWYQNISVYEEREKAPWGFFFDKPEYSKYYSKVGMYEGARSATKGIWRPQEAATCMNNNVFYYDAPSRWSIVYQLKNCVGETLEWSEFVNKDYDRENVDFTTKSIVPYENVPNLPEPTIFLK